MEQIVKKIILMIYMILIAVASQAQNQLDSLMAQLKLAPNNPAILTDIAKAYHDLGVTGDKNAVKKGLEYTDKVLALDSSQALALAYHGSLLTLRARDVTMPWSKLKYTKEGFTLLDKAVSKQPGNLEVRLVRAMNSYQVPEFMGRLQTAIADYEYIVAQPAFADWPVASKAYVHFYLGEAWQKKGNKAEARKQYEIAQALAPASESGRQARAKLTN